MFNFPVVKDSSNSVYSQTILILTSKIRAPLLSGQQNEAKTN